MSTSKATIYKGDPRTEGDNKKHIQRYLFSIIMYWDNINIIKWILAYKWVVWIL